MSNFRGTTHFTPFSERKPIMCPICEKMFTPAAEHSYKIGKGIKVQLVCSYSCEREWDKNPKKPKKVCNNGSKIVVRVVETDEVYESITKCAKALKVSNTTIYHCIYYGKTHKGLHIVKVDADDMV